MAQVIRGAVILNQNPTSMDYKRRCDRCGTILEPAEKATLHGRSPGSKITRHFSCSKCGNQQTMEIMV